MSVGDVLDGAFRGLRATFVPVVLVVLVLLGPLQLAFNLLLDRLAPELVGGGFVGSFGEVDDAIGLGDAGALLGWSSLVGVLSFLIALVAGAATVALLLQVDRGEEGDTLAAVREGLGVFVTTIVASVVLGIAGIVSLFAFVLLAVLVGTAVPVAGPILAVVLFVPALVILGAGFFGVVNLVVPIAVVERRGPLLTIGRALWVLRLRFWRLIGITLLVGLIAVAVTLGFQVPFLTLATVAGPLAWVVESLGGILAQVVSVPVTAFAALLVYLDARVRGEGLDLHLRARDLGGA